MQKKHLLSVGITQCAYNTFLDSALTLPEIKSSAYICFANVHMVVECHRDAEYRRMINNADLVAPDGMPIALLLGLSVRSRQDKISGPDFFEDVLAACAASRKSVYFYGSTPELLNKLTGRISARHPELIIKGSYSPPFRELTPTEKSTIVNMINQAAPDFIFVALGCPKQEKWMAENAGKIKGCMLGLGQAFQIYAGELQRAPRWMQYAGLEWAFRFYREPRRLWRRYFFTNTYFSYLILKSFLTNRLSTPGLPKKFA